MEEQLVSLEVAKLLKEKGFDEYCENIYRIDIEQLIKTFRKNSILPGVCCSAPTQSLTQKWLRERGNFHITIYNSASGYGYEITKANNGTHISNDMNVGPNNGGLWDIYEGALEAGLLETLKLMQL